MKMGDLELSLDDIIKKKLVKTGPNRGRNIALGQRKPARSINRAAKNPPSNSNKKNFGKARLGLAKNARGYTPQTNVADARLKIIQNQRQKITDAREKLGQIAKQTDARVRLMKLRVRKEGRSELSRIQDHILSGISDQMMQRNIRGRMAAPSYEDELMDYSDEIAYMARNISDRAVIDTDNYGSQFRNRGETPVLYRTVENDLPPSRLYSSEPPMHSWLKKRSASPINVDANIPAKRLTKRTTGTLRSDERVDNSPVWDYDEPPIVITKKVKPVEPVGILKRPPSAVASHDQKALIIVVKDPPAPSKSRGPIRTLSERFCQDGNASAQKISQLKAKFDHQLANRRTETASAGHRIVVSNLVHSVTHEDVKELFEDIGELISSKVVRPGIAEVVYKQHKDAVKAVDVYHNRQLDGQPMKCLLVNNRSTLPAAKTSITIDRNLGKAAVELDMTAFRKVLHKKSTS